MHRKEPFIIGNVYHVFVGGVDKQDIFICQDDYERFVALLLFSNSRKPVRVGNLNAKYKGSTLLEILGRVVPEYAHVDVLAYALMPNHAQLLLREKREGGISTFMHKLMTGYSMYFNMKYERTGALFRRPFRSKRISSDGYLRWLLAYIHLVPLTLVCDRKTRHSSDRSRAQQFIHDYDFSSFQDYLYGERLQSIVLSKAAWPIDVRRSSTFNELVAEFSNYHPEHQGESLL
jgi:REP element-mobilizing transposase RayT